MIRISTGDGNTDEMLGALTEKLGISKEAELSICSPELYTADSKGTAVLLCREEEIPALTERFGGNVLFLTLPVSFSAFAELAASISREPVSAEPTRESFVFDEGTGTVTKGGKSVKLTPKETELFAYLLRRRGKAVTREELRRALWSETDNTNAPDVYVSYLRRKIRPLFGDGVLVNERGIGYILKDLF